MKKLKLIGLGEGDINDKNSFSGTNHFLFSSLKKKFDLVTYGNYGLKGFYRYLSLVKSFSPYKERWRYKFRKDPLAFKLRTKINQKRLARFGSDYDLIFQIGAKCLPYTESKIKPFVTYHDGTYALSLRDRSAYPSIVPFGDNVNYKKLKQEKLVHEKASLIFTFSDRVRNSIIQDYNIEEKKVITIYAGVNMAHIPKEASKAYGSKTILFIGNDFKRKGGEVLMEAFKTVKREIKGAKLVLVGKGVPKIIEEKVIVKGFIPKNREDELVRLYREASLFVLPSLFEPFGIVLAEAMAYKNVCIGSSVGAMPEIIDDGKTGFVVQPNNADQLAERIIALLKDETLLRTMSEEGYKKFRKCFTWDVVTDKILANCEKIV